MRLYDTEEKKEQFLLVGVDTGRFEIGMEESLDELEELLEDVNAFNAKTKAAKIGRLLDTYIPNVEKMSTQVKKYKAVFSTIKAEKEALERENETLAEELKETREESVLKKMADLKLQHDYEEAVSLLEKIPPEVLAVYSGKKEPDRASKKELEK